MWEESQKRRRAEKRGGDRGCGCVVVVVAGCCGWVVGLLDGGVGGRHLSIYLAGL